MAQVKWGIMGLGNIALKFSEAFQYTKNAKLFAISSRNKNKLQAFKNKFKLDDNFCFLNYFLYFPFVKNLLLRVFLPRYFFLFQ